MSRFSKILIGTLTATALALTPITVVPAIAEPETYEVIEIDVETLTPDQYRYLVAQATLELINEYRAANGLSELRTHVVFNEKSEEWSKEMAKSTSKCEPKEEDFLERDEEDKTTEYDICFSEAFDHSPDGYGRSGENLGMLAVHDSRRFETNFYDPKKMTYEDWASIPMALFESWRGSPSHNTNMLRADYQGAGLGIHFDENGVLLATSQFYIEETQLQNGKNHPEDPITTKAKGSGKEFYVADGAREFFEIPEVNNPRDTQVIVPERAVSIADIKGGKKAQDAKLLGLESRVDERIFKADATPTTTSVEPEPTPTPAVTTASSTGENPTTSATPTSTTPTATPTTTSKPATPPTRGKSTPTTTATTSKAAPTTATSTTNTKPTTETEPTTSKQSTTKQAPAPAPTPSDGGSSTGQIVGIVLGVLALIVGLVGAGTVATGMVKLPF